MPDPKTSTDEQIQRLVDLASHHSNELLAVGRRLAELGYPIEVLFGHRSQPVNGHSIFAGIQVKKEGRP